MSVVRKGSKGKGKTEGLKRAGNCEFKSSWWQICNPRTWNVQVEESKSKVTFGFIKDIKKVYIFQIKKGEFKVGMLMHNCYSSTREAEAGLPWVQGQYSLHNTHNTLQGLQSEAFPVSQNKTGMARYFSRQVFDAQTCQLEFDPQNPQKKHKP